jgi:hypothetical protein
MIFLNNVPNKAKGVGDKNFFDLYKEEKLEDLKSFMFGAIRESVNCGRYVYDAKRVQEAARGQINK